MRRSTGLACVTVLALAILAIAGRSAVLTAAPSVDECIDGWNGALDDGTIRVDVRPHSALLTSQGAADWNGQHPVCWLTVVGSGHECQSFHTRAGGVGRWRSDPIDTCEPPDRTELFTALQPTADGRMALREP